MRNSRIWKIPNISQIVNDGHSIKDSIVLSLSIETVDICHFRVCYNIVDYSLLTIIAIDDGHCPDSCAESSSYININIR